LFAGTYGIAAVHLSEPHTQVVISAADATARELYQAAVGNFDVTKSVLMFTAGEVVPQKLPPALAETLPELPAIKQWKTAAVVCAGFTCQPPVNTAAELKAMLAPRVQS